MGEPEEGAGGGVSPGRLDTGGLTTPILFQGDDRTAFRDPAAIYHEGELHLFFTLVKTEPDGRVFLRLAKSVSRDLLHWSVPRALTPADPALNFSSPGNVVRFRNRWILCLQTYPRPQGEKYADESARLWTMASDNLEDWDEPRFLRVKGPTTPLADMGRMIDPFLVQDKDDEGKWWCFYKQNGVSMSWSRDLENWTFFGRADSGENPCVALDGGEYVLFHSPENGIGVKRSSDLVCWRDEGVFYLGQKDWPWARGRLTAGFVLDLRRDPACGKALLFFHGSGPENEDVCFDTRASLGIAWSDSLENWQWPLQRNAP